MPVGTAASPAGMVNVAGRGYCKWDPFKRSTGAAGLLLVAKADVAGVAVRGAAAEVFRCTPGGIVKLLERVWAYDNIEEQIRVSSLA